MGAFGLKQLGPVSRDEAYAFCTQSPALSAYIAGWIAEGGLERSPAVPRAWLFAERDPSGISGLVYVSSTGVVLPMLSDRGLDAFADMVRANRGTARVIVGERETVARLWNRLTRLGLKARISRDQLGYTVTRSAFADEGPPLPLTVATQADLDAVVAASAAMAREEAHDDPQGRNPELFRSRIQERIRRGRDFIHVVDGELVFKTNVAALSQLGGQIEGVYTVPRHRRRGIGRRGAATITEWVLQRAEHAVLLVNEDNDGARRIYEGMGYTQATEHRTIFVA